MKILFTSLATALVAFLMLGPPGAGIAAARQMVVALSGTTSDDAKPAETAMLAALAEKSGPGDRFVFIDCSAGRLGEIGRTSFDDDMNAAHLDLDTIQHSPRLKAQMLGKGFGTAWRLVRNGDGSGDAADNLNMPACSTAISEAVGGTMASGQEIPILFLGSAFWKDKRQPAYAEDTGFVPTDGMLFVPLSLSPYSTLGKEHLLTGYAIHLCYIDKAFANEPARSALERSWSHFFSAEGAKFSTFAPASSECLQRALDDISTPDTAPINRAAKPEMVRPEYSGAPPPSDLGAMQPPVGTLRPAGVEPQTAIPPTPTKGGYGESVRTDMTLKPFNLPLCKAPPAGPVPATVAIKWTAPGVDLDLYARPDRGDPEFLFYGRRLPTPPRNNGLFTRDSITPIGGSAFESVVYLNPLSLTAIDIAINLYHGQSAGGVDFTVGIWAAGSDCAWRKDYHIAAETGNRGADFENGPRWSVPSVSDILAGKPS